jgi:hypothetical protein
MLTACTHRREHYTRLAQAHALLSALSSTSSHDSLSIGTSQTLSANTVTEEILTSILELDKALYDETETEYTYIIVAGLFSAILLIVSIIAVTTLHKKHKADNIRMTRLQMETEKIQIELEKLKSQKQHQEIEKLESSAVYRKAKDIVQTLKKGGDTKETFNEAEWQDLIRLVNVRWNGIISNLQHHAAFSAEEIQLCCLYLIDIPVIHIGHFHGYARSSIQRKTHDILTKLQAPEGAKLKEFLLEYTEKRTITD